MRLGATGAVDAASTASEERARGAAAEWLSAGHTSADRDSQMALPRIVEATYSTIAVRALGSRGLLGLNGGPAILTDGDRGATVRSAVVFG